MCSEKHGGDTAPLPPKVWQCIAGVPLSTAPCSHALSHESNNQSPYAHTRCQATLCAIRKCILPKDVLSLWPSFQKADAFGRLTPVWHSCLVLSCLVLSCLVL